MKKIILILLVSLGLQIQAQQVTPYFCCDSITYTIDPSQGFNISLDTTGIVHDADSIDVIWQVCNSQMCYTSIGMFAYFGQIMITDTIKVCYDAYLYEANTVDICTRCDSLIYNGISWVLFNMGNPVGIVEIENKTNNNKMYDLNGREILKPKGLYIQNNTIKYEQ
tara:strand:+ start:774 stop:1271 length:498 start_codon:yes stop_codon:yes gene_type:complete